jgi:hypothetical protein
MGVHCVVHRTNLAVQFLFDLIFIAHIETFMVNLYICFSHSLKQHLQFQKPITKNQMEQDHKNVKIHWMLMLEPLKQIMAKYRPLFRVMPLCQNMANMITPMTTFVVVNTMEYIIYMYIN